MPNDYKNVLNDIVGKLSEDINDISKKTGYVNKIISHDLVASETIKSIGLVVNISFAAIGVVYLSGKNSEIFDQILKSGSVSNTGHIIIDTIKQASELAAKNHGGAILSAVSYMAVKEAGRMVNESAEAVMNLPHQILKMIKNITSSLSKGQRGQIEGEINQVR